jgi:transposase
MAYPCLELKHHLTEKELRKRYAECKNGVEKTHWQVIWLMSRKQDKMKAEQVASMIGYSVGWVRNLVRRYNKLGASGLDDNRKNNGNDLILDESQRKKLEAALAQKPLDAGLWTGPKVAAWMTKTLGQKVSTVTGWKYLVRMGFSLQMPRLQHSKSASAKEQNAFKKNSAVIPKNYKQNMPAKKSKSGQKMNHA